jgi:nucleotide-binding universal stress UspA family protein
MDIEESGCEEAEMGAQVVVGVDGSPASYTALRWALAHAARIGAQVRAVRCWTPIVARKWEAAVTGEPVPSEVVQEARAERELVQVVAAAVAWVPDGATRVAVQQRVVRGLAGPVLAGEANGAALLVVGHGPRATELRHRSVSWYCLRHATCPVLVIPPTMDILRTLTLATADVLAFSPRPSGQSRLAPHGQPAAHGIPAA